MRLLGCDAPCLGLRSFWLCCADVLAAMAEVAARVRFLADFDTKILHSVSGGLPPQPKPHVGAGAGGAGSQSGLGTRD